MSETDFRVAILATGNRKTGDGGSTADRVTRDTLENRGGFKIGLVVCNYTEGTGVHDRFDAINQEFGLKGDDRIEVVTINSRTHPEGPQSRGQTLGESSAICRLLEQRDIGFVAMLGYTKILNGEFIEEWGWKPEYGAAEPTHNGKYHPKARILNNHPSILPWTADTHDLDPYERALELYKKGKLTHTAMTWHLAAAGIDTGAVIHEEPVPIYESDDIQSLGDRTRDTEKEKTTQTLARHLILRGQHLLNVA